MTTKTLTGDYLTTYNLTSPVTRLTVAAGGYLAQGVTATGVGTYTLANYGQIRGDSVAVQLGGSGVVTNSGTILNASTTAGGGVVLGGGGVVTNKAHGLIQGYYGLGFATQSGTVANDGTIIGTGKYGVVLVAGGLVTNGGTSNTAAVIRGGIGVAGSALPVTLKNFGTVAGTGTLAIGAYLKAGGLVVNGSASDTVALMTGLEAAVGANGVAGTVINYGTLRASGGGGAVILEKGGSTTNGSAADTTALIEGGAGVIIQANPGTVRNFGTIRGDAATVATTGIGVYLNGGGQVTNGSATDITALITGLVGVGGGTISPSAVNNFGTIGGPSSEAGVIFEAGGAVTNGSATDTTARIEGNVAVAIVGAATISNFGSLISDSGVTSLATINAAVIVTGGGKVTNGSTADASAYMGGDIALYANSIALTVTNFGRMQGTTAGVELLAGGVVTNGGATATSAIIQGAKFGIDDGGVSSDTVTNFGTVIAGQVNGVGVYLSTAGFVTNGSASDAAAFIKGGQGVQVATTASVVNWGTIQGGKDGGMAGAQLGYKCNMTNEAGALASGYFGVALGDYGTLTNFGTVKATGLYSVITFFGNAKILAEGGSAFIGTIRTDGVAVDVAGGVATATAIVTSGQVLGSGTLALNGAFSIFETGVSLTVAEIDVAGAGTTVEAATNIIDSKVWKQTGGSLTVNSGDKLTFTGTDDSFAGTITGLGTVAFSGGTDALSNLHMSAASMIINGASVSVAGAIVLSKTLSVTATNFTVAAAGATLSGGGTLALSNKATNIIKGASGSATLTNTNDKITGAGNLGNGVMALVNQSGGIINGNVSSGLTINTGAATITNAGIIESTSTGGVRIMSAVANSGKLTVNAGVLELDGAISGTGSMHIGGGVAFVVTSAFTQNVTFTGATGVLELTNSQGYTGKVTGFSKTGGASLDLRDIAFATATESYSGTTVSGVLTVTDGAHTAKINLVGNYTASTFDLSNDGTGGTLVKDPTAPPAAPHLASAMASFGARSGSGAVLAASVLCQPLPILVRAG